MQKPSNIIGFGVCGAGEADRYLDATLRDFARLTTHTVIVGNNIGEKEKTMIDSFGFTLWEDNREWGKYQNKIKQDAVKGLSRFNPDWVLTLDMDEVFDSQLTREELEKLCAKGGYGYFFYIVNLYEQGYAREWSFWNNRLFAYRPPLAFVDKALHCGLAPELHWKYSNYAPFIVKHYGLMKKEDRDRKALRYAKYDPQAKYVGKDYYDFLVSRYKVTPFSETELHNEVAGEIKDYKFKDTIFMAEERKYYYVKNPAGQIIDIPAHHLDETLKRPGFTLISEVPLKVTGESIQSTVLEEAVPVKLDEEPKKLTCDKCPFIAKSEKGLKIHQSKHDRDNNS